MTAALSIEELQDFHSQYPSRGRRRRQKDGIFDDSEYVPEVEEYKESYEHAWARARLTLKERGLPTKGVDIDEYIHLGTPDVTDSESDSEGDYESEDDLN
ncbi:hypothetical protein GSI_06623 [Ganoderma sinense ZZ0214-1]|uniref:Uncharacterized protein n=1 Tax=Ganoderma sinense ZZ0214-1 TaxID=1077348 RepID=A0A2G8SDT9_9APHY|nr:hypothetical protein GSI_06623 [Ganoderma sinense ZZ0214-1]